MVKEDYNLSYEYIKNNISRNIFFELVKDLRILKNKIGDNNKKELAEDLDYLIEMLKLCVKMGKF